MERSGAFVSERNGDVEMHAAIEVLRATDASVPLTVCSDCRFVVNAVAQIQQRPGRRGRIRPQGLYATLLELVRGRDVEFKWVPGHAGVAGNERVDKLARKAMRDFVRTGRTLAA